MHVHHVKQTLTRIFDTKWDAKENAIVTVQGFILVLWEWDLFRPGKKFGHDLRMKIPGEIAKFGNST